MSNSRTVISTLFIILTLTSASCSKSCPDSCSDSENCFTPLVTGGIEGQDPLITDFSIHTVTATTADLTWSYDMDSIGHVDLEPGAVFPGASFVLPTDLHDTVPSTTFTHTAMGLAPNTQYSVMIAGDQRTDVGADGPFQTNAIYNGAFRTLPDTNEGATGNYKLAESSSVKTGIVSIQTGQDESFIFWKSGATEVRGQYMNTSTGTPETWDKWPTTGANNGAQVFNSIGVNGMFSAIPDDTGGVLIGRIDSIDYGIYAASIYNNAGALGASWGAGSGSLVYKGAGVTSSLTMTLTCMVEGIVTGMPQSHNNLIYDNSIPFASVVNGDVVLNESTGLLATVTNKVSGSFLILSGNIISPSNLAYRVGDSSASVLDSIDTELADNMFTDSANWPVGGLVANITQGSPNIGYITAKAPNGPNWDYTINRSISCSTGDSIRYYPHLADGTQSTNYLYRDGENFLSYPVQIGDIAVNLSTGHGGVVSDINYTSNGLLVLSNTTTSYPFSSHAADTFSVVRIPAGCGFITSGRCDGMNGSPAWARQVGRDFVSVGVQAGDILFNIDSQMYAIVTCVAPNNQLNLSNAAFTAAPQNFIVYRQTGDNLNAATFFWIENDNIYGKTVRKSDCYRTYPSALSDSKFTVMDGVQPARNAKSLPAFGATAWVVYELYDQATFRWHVRVKMVSAAGDYIQGGGSSSPGMAICTAANSGITKAMQDGNGGLWVLVNIDATSFMIGHVSRVGVVWTQTFNNARYPDMATIGTNLTAFVYELNSAGYWRVVAFILDSTPTVVLPALAVRSSYNETRQIQMHPRVHSDGSGGMIVSWLETSFYPSVYYTLFAQHFDAAGNRLFGDDRFVGIPVLDNQETADPYAIEHGIVRYNDGAAPNAGVFYWTDQRSAVNPVDIYFQPVAD